MFQIILVNLTSENESHIQKNLNIFELLMIINLVEIIYCRTFTQLCLNN